MITSEYYVYVYLDPRKPGNYNYGSYSFDFEPFYVGKGKGDRMYFHLRGHDTNLFKINKINKILTAGLNPVILSVKDNLNEQESLSYERELIAMIGRCSGGPLTNLTDGGEGVSGLKMTRESRKKMSDKKKQFFDNPINRLVCSDRMKEFHKNNPDFQAGENSYWHGKNKSSDIKLKVSDSLKKFHDNNPGIYQGENSSMFGKKHSDKTIEKMKAAQQGEQSHSFGKRGQDGYNYGKGKPVIQMSKDGEYIKEWPNAYRVQQELNISGVHKCCVGINSTSGNFKWKFKNI